MNRLLFAVLRENFTRSLLEDRQADVVAEENCNQKSKRKVNKHAQYPSRQDLMSPPLRYFQKGWLRKEFQTDKPMVMSKRRMRRILSVGPNMAYSLGQLFLTVSKYDNVKMFDGEDHSRTLAYESLVENLKIRWKIINIVREMLNVTNTNLPDHEMKSSLKLATNQITSNMDNYSAIVDKAISYTTKVSNNFESLCFYFEEFSTPLELRVKLNIPFCCLCIYHFKAFFRLEDDQADERRTEDLCLDSCLLYENATGINESLSILFLKGGLRIGLDAKILRKNCLYFKKEMVKRALRNIDDSLSGMSVVGEFFIATFQRLLIQLRQRSR
uniref:Uncharacterized protein n=1 Tax=Romanomermis culicivorax TaxID=13658 RepID=A0A915HFX7_ROMCU